MKKQAFETFVGSKLGSLQHIKGGIFVYCKDRDGNNLGSYETDCLDSSQWINDCKLSWPATVSASGMG